MVRSGAAVSMILTLALALPAQPAATGEKMVVMNLRIERGVDASLGRILNDLLVTEVHEHSKAQVFGESDLVEMIGFESTRQLAGCDDEGCLAELRGALGVGRVLFGGVGKVGTKYVLSLKLIDFEGARVLARVTETAEGSEEQLLVVTRRAVRRLFVSKVESPTIAAPPPVTVGKAMVAVPAGVFLMGCNDGVDTKCKKSEQPGRKVHLEGFTIDRTEVTVEAFERCVKAGACTAPRTGGACNWGQGDRATHPVNCVAWEQAHGFCTWLGKRLPTEAEWEKAARGTGGRVYTWGNTYPSCEQAVMVRGGNGCGRGHTWPVGSKPKGASPYGALDMAGNVWEWVADWYGKEYYLEAPKNAPRGPDAGPGRACRGGSWLYGDNFVLRTSARAWFPVEEQETDLGFRCAR